MKKLLAPIQNLLISKRMCPGCTHPLDKVGNRHEFRPGRVMVQCKCRRKYILNQETNVYRRATFEEEKEFLNKRRNIG